MGDRLSTNYINSTDYDDLSDRLKELKSVLDDLNNKQLASRKLRYAEVDIEAEREEGRLQPDELYVPVHMIDTNVRREQSPYVQYITQSTRAVICEDADDDTIDFALLEKDLTKKIRYDGWQLSQFANIDGFQSNGYSVMEVVQDLSAPGGVSHESVQFGDFAFVSDTRDIQAVEMTARAYYFTRTKLLSLCGDLKNPKPDSDWNFDQVEMVISREPEVKNSIEASDAKDKSLYMVYKVMFRVDGIVNVAWCQPEICKNWLRNPRKLFLGRRKLKDPNTMGPIQQALSKVKQMATGVPESDMVYETRYPYVIFPYLISENDTISQLKGRVFLDQDMQEGVTSLLSSTLTKARRSAGLYFSKDVDDPNDDLLLQKNIFFRSGCLINAKVKEFQLTPPDPAMFQAVQSLIAANQNETSQVNFAAMNRKDSRKTAKEITVAERQEQILSTVQVVLFSIALTQLYRIMTEVIISRVICGIVKVNPQLMSLYQRKFAVKPAGDVDVIEKNELIQKMMNTWPVVQQTPFAQIFLMDLMELMFPERFAKYQAAVAQQQQQQQSVQAQQQQQMMQFMMQMANGIVLLSKHKEFFSDIGKLHALPIVEQTAQQIEQLTKQMQQGQPKQLPPPQQ